jgi:hypothetical protein
MHEALVIAENKTGASGFVLRQCLNLNFSNPSTLYKNDYPQMLHHTEIQSGE